MTDVEEEEKKADADESESADETENADASENADEKADASAKGDDWGYPSFARGFPREAELDALVKAFADGDYLTVRTRAPVLAAREGVSPAVKKAAELLRARVEPDKTARTFFALAAALLVFLTVWWVTHDGPEPHGPAPAPPAALK